MDRCKASEEPHVKNIKNFKGRVLYRAHTATASYVSIRSLQTAAVSVCFTPYSQSLKQLAMDRCNVSEEPHGTPHPLPKGFGRNTKMT